MELIKRFRVDTLKLSTENLPVAEADGTTCYEVDTMKLYIYYKGQWYLQEEVTETAEDTQETQNNTRANEIIINDNKTEVEPVREEPVREEPIIEEPKEKMEK